MEQRRIEFTKLKSYLTLRNVLIALAVFILYLFFSNLVKTLVFIALFVPAGIFSIKVTRVMPQLNFEIITPASFFIGYLYGWPAGLFYGVIMGAYMWSTAFSLNQFILLQLFLNGILGFLGSYFAGNGWIFGTAYYISMLVRNILFFFLGLAIGGNPMENTLHTLSSVFGNMLVFPPFMILLYRLANII